MLHHKPASPFLSSLAAFQLQCSKTRCSGLVCCPLSEVAEKQGEMVLDCGGVICSAPAAACSVRISKAGWLQNSLRKPDGKPRDSLWQLLPLCHKQNTRRLSLLPTPTGLGRCQTEQSLSQPLLLSNATPSPRVSYSINRRDQQRLYLCESNNEGDV